MIINKALQSLLEGDPAQMKEGCDFLRAVIFGYSHYWFPSIENKHKTSLIKPILNFTVSWVAPGIARA